VLLTQVNVGGEDKDGSDGHQNNNNGRDIIGDRVGLAFCNHFIILELCNNSFVPGKGITGQLNNVFSAYSGRSQQNLSQFKRQVKTIETGAFGHLVEQEFFEKPL